MVETRGRGRRTLAEHGAPLAIKCANGSAFKSNAVRALLDRWGILAIYSPPRCPEYNGSIESGIRWIKETALDLSFVWGESHGEHLPSAATLLNGQLKRGAHPTPDGRREERRPITQHERNRMHRLVGLERLSARSRQGIAPDAQLTHASASALERNAIPAALKILGVLHIQRP